MLRKPQMVPRSKRPRMLLVRRANGLPRTRVGRTDPTLMGLLAVVGVAAVSWAAGLHGPLGPSSMLFRWVSQSSSAAPSFPPGIAGEWYGTFGAGKDSRLSIAGSNAIEAVLISSRYRETFHIQVAGKGVLLLKPISVTRADGTPAANYSLDTAWVEMTTDGSALAGHYKDGRGAKGSIAMRRSNQERAASGQTGPAAYVNSGAPELHFNGPAYIGRITSGNDIRLHVELSAGNPQCTRATPADVQCDVILYSGGHPNPGVSMEDFRREFALTIDEVDIAMTLLGADGAIVARSDQSAAGATPGYMQVLIAKVPPGSYVVVVSSRASGLFSVLWSSPLGD
jgi:hypothetical protein